MSSKNQETASFVLRFNQKIFENEQGETDVSWRGNVRHVQGGTEERFSDMEDALVFIQNKLSDMTINATAHKSKDQQEGILAKSFNLWKKVAHNAPQVVFDTLKDPKKQVSHIQDQIQDQIQKQLHQVGDVIEQKKIEFGNWGHSSKTELSEILNLLSSMSSEISLLNEKVNDLSDKLDA